MFAKRLNIIDRHRMQMRDLASLSDFTYEEADHVDGRSLIDNPQVSLYCLDHEREEAVFVILPKSINLSQVPFVYQAQFDNAEYLLILSFSDYLELAAEIKVEDSQLICIHNVGRCGSTLLVQALSLLDEVTSFSEPDVFSSVVTLRHLSKPRQIPLLRAAYKFMFRPQITGNTSRFALKLRNHCADVMDIFIQALPDAKHLFMYRNAHDWVASLYRIIYNTGRADVQLTYDEAIDQHRLYFNLPNESVAHLFDSSQGRFSITICRAMLWVQIMNRYVQFYEQGFRPVAMRYEDLVGNRETMLLKLLEFLDIPRSRFDSIVLAFEHDSQAGTTMARDDATSGNSIQLPTIEYDRLSELFARQPLLNRPDYVLPGTILV